MHYTEIYWPLETFIMFSLSESVLTITVITYLRIRFCF